MGVEDARVGKEPSGWGEGRRDRGRSSSGGGSVGEQLGRGVPSSDPGGGGASEDARLGRGSTGERHGRERIEIEIEREIEKESVRERRCVLSGGVEEAQLDFHFFYLLSGRKQKKGGGVSQRVRATSGSRQTP